MTYYEHCKYRNLDGVVIACTDFECEEVKEVVMLGTIEIEKMCQNAGENKKSLITGVGKHNGELISLLDLNSITLEENA
mgnify:CR=1 FL=1